MGHDQLFKTLLEGFLKDFLELFFPDVAERLDFETMRNLPREYYTNVPEGSVREADFVARVETHAGAPEFILVHVEVQSRPEKDFARRMFEYACLLWLNHQAPIFPIVLYLKGGEGLKDEEYQLTLFGRELFRFRYASVGLARLEAREYLGQGPLAAALAALMARGETSDAALQLAEMLRVVLESALDDARKLLLWNVIETYTELSHEEAERFQRILERKEYRKVQDVELTWADRLVEQGREAGRKAGVIEGKRDSLLRLLATRFGPLSEETSGRIMTITSVAELDALLDRAATASSIEEFGM